MALSPEQQARFEALLNAYNTQVLPFKTQLDNALAGKFPPYDNATLTQAIGAVKGYFNGVHVGLWPKLCDFLVNTGGGSMSDDDIFLAWIRTATRELT